VPKQHFVVGLHRLVAFASGILHSLDIEEVNFAAGILDHARLLQRRATVVTLVRRTPSISARYSWVNSRVSL
jgi:hypothetical protein